MAYGDVSYSWIFGGSTGASANTVHNLFGTYNGLSLLNASDVVHIQLKAVTNDFRVGPKTSISNDLGYQVSTTVWEDLPPVRVDLAKNLGMINEVDGSNSSALFVIWKRVN